MPSPGHQPTANRFQADDEFSMEAVWRLLSWAWAKKIFLIVGVVIGGGIGLFLALTTPKSYTATVRMLPAIDSGSSFSIPGLASLGMGFGPSPTYEPIFEKIIHSDSIINGVIEKEWASRDGTAIGLADLYSVFPDSDEEIDKKKSREKLKKIFSTSAISFKRDQLTGYMEMTVEVPKDPVVASDIANHLVKSLQEVLVQQHDILAGSRRSFLEKRFATVADELLVADEALAQFEKSNRNYSQSPLLVREHGRLQRNVDVYAVVVTEIQKQIELAQISNQHSLPRVVVIDQATPPLFPSGPKRRMMVILGMMLGLFFMVGFFLFIRLSSLARYKVLSG